MKYKSVDEIGGKPNFERACCLDGKAVARLKGAIQKAYANSSGSGTNDFSIDEINKLVAPYIRTPEEAFYAAQVILSDVLGANEDYQKRKALLNFHKN